MTFASPDTLTPADVLGHPRGSVQVALEAARIGRELGPRYNVGGLLGRGGFASVWEVVDTVVAERLAAKRFESDAVRGTEFYREMSALFRLDHPNIVRIVNLLDVSEVTRYLFLEYCSGGTLRELFRKTRREGRSLPLDVLSRMAVELARGLSYAHQLGLVHRDLKPENILFTGSGRPNNPGVTKLADFGLVRALRTGAIASLSRLSGTPAYLAPEQISGQFSPASDLYALGVVLYEALHGRTPFDGSPEEIALQHLNRPPAINPELPDRWVEVLSALLEKDPANRPSEASWVIDRLEPRDQPSIESDATARSTVRCLGVEARSIVAEGAWGVLVLSPFGLFRFRHSTAARSGIVHRAVTLARASMDNSLWLASGSELLELAAGDPEPRTVVQLDDAIDDFAFSRVNRDRVAVRSGAVLSVYEISGREPRQSWRRDFEAIAPDSLAWLADGRLAIATGGESPLIEILDPTGRTVQTIDLPGQSESMNPFENVLIAKLRIDGIAFAYRIEPEGAMVEALEGPGELVALAVDPSDFHGIFGLFSSGEIVRWNLIGEPRSMGRFPEEEGPFRGLAVSGELGWALSARNDSTWLMVRSLSRLE